MRLTDRDHHILRWANGHGYVSTGQIADFMGTDFSTAARRARVLCDAGLMTRRPFPMSGSTVLIPTRDACALTGDDLWPIAGVRVATSRHDCTLVDCAHALQTRFKMTFEPERRLRQREFAIGGHLPDGLLHQNDAPPIGVELELSQKAPSRLTTIFDAYAANLDISEIWYVVMTDVIEKFVRRLAEGRSYIVIKRWRGLRPKFPTTEK